MGEDAAERDKRAVDRFRGQALGAQARDHARDVVGRDLGRSLVAEGGEQVFVEVVAVVLECPLSALACGDEGFEIRDPDLSKLSKGQPRRRRQLTALGLGREEVALPARLGELAADGLGSRARHRHRPCDNLRVPETRFVPFMPRLCTRG